MKRLLLALLLAFFCSPLWATFTYTDGATNDGNSGTASTGTHGITINSGDLVVAYVHSNAVAAITPNDSGWTEAIDERADASETAQHALYWKVAGSEPTSYTWSVSSSQWRVVLKVFTAASTPEVDAAATTEYWSTPTTDKLIMSAIDGEVISDDAVSIVCGGKDNRKSPNEAYTTANNSFVSAVGETTTQITACAHRIFGTGETFSGNVTVETSDGSDSKTDKVYSAHISFVEGGGGPSTPTAVIVRRRGR